MNPGRKKTPRRAANRRASATASGNRGRRNGRLPHPPHAPILPNERGILPPSHLLSPKPGNITVYRVAVAEDMNCHWPTPNRKGVLQLYGVLPQSGQTVVLTSACPGQCAGPAGSGGGAQNQFDFVVQPPGEGLPLLVNAAAPQPPTIALPRPPDAVPLQPSNAVLLQPASDMPRCPVVPEHCAGPAGSGGGAQNEFDFAVKPPGEGLPQQVNAAAPQLPTIALPRPPDAVLLQPSNAVPLQPSSDMPRCPAVREVSKEEMAFEYVQEKLEEELQTRLASLSRPNATSEETLADTKRIKLIRKILAM